MKGVLLLNLGTPDAPDPPSVRRYLRQFLMDPDVVDIAYPLRWLLVHALILPRRPALSARAYQKIWTDEGSPLATHTRRLSLALGERLGGDYVVEWGMRYGNPSIRSALEKLRSREVSDLVVLPLFPQYSSAATRSAMTETRASLKKMRWEIAPRFLPEFFDNPGFIGTFAEITRREIAEAKPDFIVFSFHGLPERQIRNNDSTQNHCLRSQDCCERVPSDVRCYRAQSYRTAQLIAQELGLRPEQYTVGFQSRLGRTPWIKPYTDHIYEELARQGKRRLVVLSPSFVADCLETLEEIAIRGKEQFTGLGGEDLRLVPSLNSHPRWVEAVAQLVTAKF